MAKTVIALFDDLKHAHRAVEELRKSRHFTSEDVTLMAHDADNRFSRFIQQKHVEKVDATKVGAGVATGAGIGTVVGAIVGFLVGAGVIFVPGLGPVLAGGPLVATLLGAAGGAAAGSMVGGLIGLGIPEDDAHLYAEGLRRGGTLVLVKSEDHFADDAADILARHHPVDIEARGQRWRENGWTGRFDRDGEPLSAEKIEEEQAAYAARRAVGEPRAYEMRASPLGAEAYGEFESEFRRHFESNRNSGEDFDEAREGYQFGTMLGADKHFARQSWSEVEADAHRNWAERSRKSWDKFKHYVAYAWYKTKSEIWDSSTPTEGY